MKERDSVGAVLEAAGTRAEQRGVPEDVVVDARRATRRAFAHMTAPASSRRVAAYFDACVRRRLVRRHGGTAAAARVIADAVVADLVEAGRSAAAVVDELERGWSSCLPAEVLQEYRSRLCA